MAPDHYSRFIDVFGGSGTVTMSRPIQQGCMEVYNDFNSNLTNLFCCVKNRPLALLAELGFLPLNTRDDFNVLYKFLSKGEITDDYLQEEMELTEILLKPPEAEAIRTLLLESLAEEVIAVPSAEEGYITEIDLSERHLLENLLLEGMGTKLTERQRTRLWLYCINGVTAAEIASFEGIAQQNVSKSIASAKKKLKKFLKNRV